MKHRHRRVVRAWTQEGDPHGPPGPNVQVLAADRRSPGRARSSPMCIQVAAGGSDANVPWLIETAVPRGVIETLT